MAGLPEPGVLSGSVVVQSLRVLFGPPVPIKGVGTEIRVPELTYEPITPAEAWLKKLYESIAPPKDSSTDLSTLPLNPALAELTETWKSRLPGSPSVARIQWLTSVRRSLHGDGLI